MLVAQVCHAGSRGSSHAGTAALACSARELSTLELSVFSLILHFSLSDLFCCYLLFYSCCNSLCFRAKDYSERRLRSPKRYF